MKCPKCDFENPNGAKFCVECGNRFKRECTKCGFGYGRAEENYKLYSLVYERNPAEIQPAHFAYPADWCVYREFYCPGCGTQIEVEATVPGTPIVHNVRLKEY